ncbi:MAG: hypothetical protein GY810_23790 [Aureispira sp.]|nr:hypothetical protein [Aureispira sp.]
MKKVLIVGATGVVGNLVLKYCLASTDIDEVRVLGRKSVNNQSPKIKEVLTDNFKDYTPHHLLFENIDAAFFCIGVYTGQVPKDQFKEITVDYAIKFAETVKQYSPKATFCLLSGAGADRRERSRVAFAKFKGMAENQISALDFDRFYTFRPGYIYPVTPRKEPNITYKISRFLYPLIKLFGKNMSIKSTELAKGMFNVGLNGAKQEILENRAILEYS